MRPSGRKPDQLPVVSFDRNYIKHAEGSCLVRLATPMCCARPASRRRVPPPWMKGLGEGWITAEYGMLPRATTRDATARPRAGKQSGRTQEIQRLVGRSACRRRPRGGCVWWSRAAACRIPPSPSRGRFAQEGRHAFLEARGAEDMGRAHPDQAGAFGVGETPVSIETSRRASGARPEGRMRVILAGVFGPALSPPGARRPASAVHSI